MVEFVRTSWHPVSFLTNHGLIKLLVLRALAQQNQFLEPFTGQPQIIWEPAQLGGVPIEEEDKAHAQLGGMEVEEEDWSPSNSIGGI